MTLEQIYKLKEESDRLYMESERKWREQEYKMQALQFLVQFQLEQLGYMFYSGLNPNLYRKEDES